MRKNQAEIHMRHETCLSSERHGRALARIVVDGLDVGEILVAEGLARRSKPRRGWCSVLGVMAAP